VRSTLHHHRRLDSPSNPPIGTSHARHLVKQKVFAKAVTILASTGSEEIPTESLVLPHVNYDEAMN
jgi:hypothetical protein